MGCLFSFTLGGYEEICYLLWQTLILALPLSYAPIFLFLLIHIFILPAFFRIIKAWNKACVSPVAEAATRISCSEPYALE